MLLALHVQVHSIHLSLTRSCTGPQHPASTRLWQFRRMHAQDSPNTAMLRDLISTVDPLVGTPVHAWRLFRKGVKNVWFGSQAHSDFLRFYKSAHPDGFLLTFISQLVAMAAREMLP
jgi:hypothetical protein